MTSAFAIRKLAEGWMHVSAGVVGMLQGASNPFGLLACQCVVAGNSHTVWVVHLVMVTSRDVLIVPHEQRIWSVAHAFRLRRSRQQECGWA